MNNPGPIATATIRLPKLAATAFLFLGLSTNTHLDSAPRLWPVTMASTTHAAAPHAKAATPTPPAPQAKVTIPTPIAPALVVVKAPAVVTPVAEAPVAPVKAAHTNIVVRIVKSAIKDKHTEVAAFIPAATQKEIVTQEASFKDTAKTSKDLDLTHVLSVRDADLYRAAFDAQAQSNWQAADDALAQVKDKKLVGHVLADRYNRRTMTLDEAKTWLAAYGDLPEADDIYSNAQKLHGVVAAHLTQPVASTEWSGKNGSYGTPLGFRATADNSDTAKKTHSGAGINAALRRGEPTIARELLATELQRGTLSSTDAGEVTGHIAAAFYYNGQIERARPMAHMAAQGGTPLGLWIDGMSAWKQQDYIGATRSFASLAQAPKLSPWDHAAAAFWAYRGAKHTGDEAQAHHWLMEAAKYPRSFYGYLASAMTGERPAGAWKLPEFTIKNAATLAQYPAGWQALALVQVGHEDLAEDELRRLTLNGHRDVQMATLALAEKAHMPTLSMQLGGIVTNDNGQLYEAAMYPLPPWQPSDGFKVDRALIYALMKHESQFDPDAVSGSGACGLMQIMPSTARVIANDNQFKGSMRKCSDQLLDPATNMAMGQKYVRVLAGQPMIGDNLVLLLAAYNAGPGNLQHWLDGDDRRDPLLFMESLPVHETRDYVQQVLLQYWMYRSRLGEPEESVAQLAHGEWPRYALNDNNLKTGDVKINAIRHAAAVQPFTLASLDSVGYRAAK